MEAKDGIMTINGIYRLLQRETIASRVLALVAPVLSLLICFSSASAQVVLQQKARLAAAPVAVGEATPAVEGEKPADTEQSEAIERDFPGGASLKTDPEMERLLERADLFGREGRYDLAMVLWQKVLDDSTDTVMTRDAWADNRFEHKYRKYKSVATEVERTLAALPEAPLKLYRIKADGEAQAILAAAFTSAKREAALAEIVRRYFLSSLGDDAALELAALQLDRLDFIGASRLLSKVLDEYPNPTVSRADLLMRLAVANARLGDIPAARRTLADLAKLSLNNNSERVRGFVEAEVERVAAGSTAPAEQREGWSMKLGGPARTGTMPNLPSAATEATLTELWEQNYEKLFAEDGFDIAGSGAKSGNRRRVNVIMNRFGGQATAEISSLADLASRWQEHRWRPRGEMLLDGGRLWVTAGDRVAYFEGETGKFQGRTWPSLFDMDGISQMMVQLRMQGIGDNEPRWPAEVQWFGDRVHLAMSLGPDALYVVEGQQPNDAGPAVDENARMQMMYGGGAPRRTRTNFLAAYDKQTGKIKWRVGPAGNTETTKFDMGFLAAPIRQADLLLVPVSDNGSIWLYALAAEASEAGKRDGGRVMWKTYLCDEPAGGCNPWSPVGLAVDGGDAYVATGSGVVFAVDALSGNMRWAVRYQRTGAPSNRLARFGIQGTTDPVGWEEDTIIPLGQRLIILASDFDHLLALDRRTGEFLWESPRIPSEGDAPADYCLGVAKGRLVVAGKNIVRCYDTKGGRLVWQRELADSFGRGALTAEAVYLPVKDSVLHLGTEKGEIISQVGFTSPSGEPVGNLFTDGQRLYGVGAGRVYALTRLTNRLESLGQKIEAGDGRAQLERMRLRNRMKERPEAIADLQAAIPLIVKSESSEKAAAALYEGISELALADANPQLTLQMLAGAPQTEGAPASTVNAAERENLKLSGDGLLYSALHAVETKKIVGAAADVLRVAPQCHDNRLQAVARKALEVTARPEDAELITNALGDARPALRVIGTAGIAGAFGEKAGEMFTGLLADTDHGVKIAAATALANLGKRESLPVLIELLDSPDLNIRARSAQVLRAFTGQQFQFAAYDKEEPRAKAVAEWKAWFEKEGATAKLTFPFKESALLLGRTLICYYGMNKVVELDASGKEVWQTSVMQPWGCEGLPNGHRLVASYNSRMIIEYDTEGKEVWKMANLADRPFSVRRLENGNTLVPFYSSQKLVEIDPQKKTVWEVSVSGNPMDARRLPNGNTLVCLLSNNTVVEIDQAGKVVWQLENMFAPRSAQRLENGNTLVAQSNGGKIVEIDREKNVVWQKEGLSAPFDAQRLPNGNTIIVHNQGVLEVNPKGDIVWQRNENGVSRASRF
jgi:outer membrane protein assembly factor BamB